MSAQVLVVDDDPTSRRSLIIQLGKLGIEADEACTGLEALQKVFQHYYSLVFMDIAMPDMDGYEATVAIRSAWPKKIEKTLAIVGVTSCVDRERCIGCGMDEVVLKPMYPQDLSRVVERFLPAG